MTTESLQDLTTEIAALKRERDAVVLAHTYQRAEVQDAADVVGDSLSLSREAAATDKSVIVFAGVHFMAETAKILSPDKTVILPEADAGCPMANMITADDVVKWREQYPDTPVVMYVNSSAAVKAVSDVCVTSANAVEVVRSLGADRVLFGPDRNLAWWVAAKLLEIEVIAWDGYCPTHDRVTAAIVAAAKAAHPNAEIMAHPECRPDVSAMADVVLSTSGMVRHVASSTAREFIVVTEAGIIHQLELSAPGKRFYQTEPTMLCPNMKLTTLDKVRDALRDLTPRIDVPEGIRVRALASVERMVAIG